MTCDLLHLLLLSSLLDVVSVGARKHVTVPDVFAVTGEDTVIKCYVKFDEKEDLIEESITFKMLNTNKRSRYQCTIGSSNPLSSDGQLRLIDFSTKPENVIFSCEGENINFRWEFNPRDCQNTFVIHSIYWTFYPVNGKPTIIGTLDKNMVYKRGLSHFGNRAEVSHVALKETIPQLLVKSLTLIDSGVYQIKIIFFSKENLKSYKQTKSSKETNKDTGEHNNSGEVYVSEADLDGANTNSVFYDDTNEEIDEYVDSNALKMLYASHDDDDCVDLFGTDEAENTSENVAMTLYTYLETRRLVLKSTMTLNVMEPPPNMSLFLKVLEKSGEFSLFCSVLSYNNNTSFKYINFVIKHYGKVIGESSNTSSLLLKISSGFSLTNYSCELTGGAFRCVNEKLEKSSDSISISELLPRKEFFPQIDTVSTFFELIFFLEGVVCIFLMIWNCKLLLSHVTFLSRGIIWRHEKKLIKTMETIEAKRIRRMSQTLSKQDRPTISHAKTRKVPTPSQEEESASSDQSIRSEKSTDVN